MISTDLLGAAELVAGADLVLDGILGIGGRGWLREPAASLAAVARETDALVLAVDLPSGVDADSGEALDPARAVDADRTVVLGTLKPGLLVGDGARLSGDLEVVDIGLGLDAVSDDETVVLVDDALAREVLTRPAPPTTSTRAASSGSARAPSSTRVRPCSRPVARVAVSRATSATADRRTGRSSRRGPTPWRCRDASGSRGARRRGSWGRVAAPTRTRGSPCSMRSRSRCRSCSTPTP